MSFIKINFKRSKEDERSVLISLTDKGVRLKEETRAIPTMIFDKTGLTSEHSTSIIATFETYLNTKKNTICTGIEFNY
ncbi:hypothetical protein [Bacillus sp. SM2101]|uniref:hypothetical protein n=1 Tax=Bacillus sp. SM2101 TaxID=2805366 RepID=UPI001BDE59C8|nr:hypothetical protein [Bacillus sp. SM2101]